MRKSISIAILFAAIIASLVACGKEKSDATVASTSEALYTSVQELFVNGEYREAEARIDSIYRSPSLTEEEKSMVYLLRSRLHQLRDNDPYRANKYMKLHVETLNDIRHDTAVPWLAGGIALLFASSSVWYYTRNGKRSNTTKSASDTWASDWEQAKKSFASTASGHLILGAVCEETFTQEQRKRLLADIESCFTNTILHMSQEAPHVNREEVLYCICSGLHVTPRRIADCLLTTPSTLRSRKARLSNKLPEYMYGTFFTKRESAC